MGKSSCFSESNESEENTFVKSSETIRRIPHINIYAWERYSPISLETERISSLCYWSDNEMSAIPFQVSSEAHE